MLLSGDPEEGLQSGTRGKHDIDSRSQLHKAGPRLGLGPELAAVVKVEEDGNPGRIRRPDRGERLVPGAGAEGGCDSGDHERVRARQQRRPIECTGSQLGHGRSGPVVIDGRRSRICPLFQKVDPGPAGRLGQDRDLRHVDAMPASSPHDDPAKRRIGKSRDPGGFVAKAGRGHRDIQLRAAARQVQRRRALESLVEGRSQPDHGFAERHDPMRGSHERFSICVSN